MKTINFFAKSILPIAVLLSLWSCDKEEATTLEEENILVEKSIQKIGIPEEEWINYTENLNTKNLLSAVSGSNFKRFFLDVNFDGYDDLVAIKTRSTGTGRTEVHILDGKTGFTKFIVQTGTALPETGSNYDFLVGWSQGGGLMIYAIKKRNTGTKSTEIHVISSKLGYSRFYSQNGTPLPETDSTYSFRLVGSLHPYLHHIQVYKNRVKNGLLDARTTYKSFF